MFFLKINKCLCTFKIFIFILISYDSFSADYNDCNHDAFIKVVKGAFSQRRKKLKNALKNFTNLNDIKLHHFR